MGGNCQCEPKPAPIEEVTSPASSPKKSEQAQDSPQPAETLPAEESHEEEEEPEPVVEPKITVAVIGARGLRNADWLAGKSDCLCVVKAGAKDQEPKDKELIKTRTICDTLEPVWNEEADIVEYEYGESLEFSVWDAEMKDFLGKVSMDSSQIQDGFNGELLLGAGKGIKAYLRVKVKKFGGDYPPGPPVEFTINLKDIPKKEKLGLDVDVGDGKFLYVRSVNKGPLQAYNAGKKPELQLKTGDFIVSAKGADGVAVAGVAQDILSAMVTAKEQLQIEVRRPEELQVAVEKETPKEPLGLEFPAKIVGNTLLIENVTTAGAFPRWNKNNSESELRKGDRIVAIGTFRGEATQIRSKMLKDAKFNCTVVRPAHSDHWWFW